MNITTVKVFIEAKTKEGIILRQLQNNTERNTWFDYSDPVKDGDNYICWYYDDLMKRVGKKK